MSQADIDSAVNTQMKKLAPQIIAARCQQVNLPAVGSPLNGAASEQKQSNYENWMNYVADHIRNNVAFGSDYSEIAKQALTGLPPEDNAGAGGCRSAEVQAVGNPTTAYDIGNALYHVFAGSDQAVSRSAAQSFLFAATLDEKL